MIALLTTLISIISSVLVVYLCSIKWFWFLPIFIGIWALVIIIIFFSCGLIGYLVKKEEYVKKPNKFFSVLNYHVCNFVKFFLRVKVKKEGFEKLNNLDGKMLLVCNHQSNLDPLMILACTKPNGLTFVMKDSILKVPIIGRWLTSSGFFSLDRENNRKGLETIIKTIKRVEEGYPVGIFPEGTRSKGKDMGCFHDGTFKIALRSKSPICIFIVDNTYKNKKRFPFRSTKILIRVCEVLEYDDFKDLSTSEIALKVKNIMEDNLNVAREKYEWLR